MADKLDQWYFITVDQSEYLCSLGGAVHTEVKPSS